MTFGVLLFLAGQALAAEHVRSARVDKDVSAVLDSELQLVLVVRAHDGDAWSRLALRLTGDSADWPRIAELNGRTGPLLSGQRVRIPFSMLRPRLQLRAIRAMFPQDELTETGWRHKVVAGTPLEGESLWKLAEWFTGDGSNYSVLREANGMSGFSTRPGDTILIPSRVLSPSFLEKSGREARHEREASGEKRRAGASDKLVAKSPSVTLKTGGSAETSSNAVVPTSTLPLVTLAETAQQPAQASVPSGGELRRSASHSVARSGSQETIAESAPALQYVTSGDQPHALYKLRKGEALYSSVAIRFTGRVYVPDVNEAVDQIVQANGIKDVARLPVGYPVKIPIGLLSAEYRPLADPRRVEHEQSKRERQKVTRRVAAQNLAGVHVILDSGHGGRDVGTIHDGIWESDYVYDVTCRLREILEKNTGAKVWMTTKSVDQGYAISDRNVLGKRRDHVVLTSPRYVLGDPIVGVNLRWYLANSIYRRAVSSGTAPQKIVFISIHADSLHPSLRGAMAYIPGEHVTRGTFAKSSAVYLARAEVRESPRVTQTRQESLRAEGLSQGLARSVMESFSESGLSVHPFHSIRESVTREGKEWVPAILRHNKVPTRLLLEICNLGNEDDRKLIQTKKYRQKVANAMADGLVSFFSAGTPQPAPLVAKSSR